MIMKKALLVLTGLKILLSDLPAQTVTDFDGNVYNTITIGNQVWMKENLKVVHYNNGDQIPNVTNDTEWNKSTTGACCDYENIPDNGVAFGKLYNWYALVDSRKLCPTDMHVPTDAEWETLTDYLANNGFGYQGSGNDIAKSIATTSGWKISNTPGNVGNDQTSNNNSGFTALPAGSRDHNGTFFNLGDYCYFWTSTELLRSNCLDRNTGYNKSYVYAYGCENTVGSSVRCLSDSTVTKVNEERVEDYYQIYPNPAKERISISGIETGSAKIHVFTYVGECILKTEIERDENSINVSSFPNGIYLIIITGNDWSVQRKLTKY